MPTILSIQSHVAYGHVGNASAVFPMQRLGCEVWPVHTVQFSNHPGYGGWRGQVFDGAAIRDLTTGIAERGVMARCDGVLSGYLGSAEIGAAILDAVALVKSANPRALWCCDPVIGDHGPGVYVRSGVPEFFRERAVPQADILTPNQFELEHLTGCAVTDVDGARKAVAALHARGPKIVLVTSYAGRETPPDALDMLVSDGAALHRLRAPRFDRTFNGAGDAMAALFFVHHLAGRDAAAALAEAGSAVHGLLRATAAAGSREILTVQAQAEFVAPSIRLSAERIA